MGRIHTGDEITMNVRVCITMSCVVTLFLLGYAPANVAAQSSTDRITVDLQSLKPMKSRWADYFGTHYARSAEQAGVAWNTVRSFGGTHIGFHVTENPTAAVRKGPFTGKEIRLELSDFHGPRGGDSAERLIPDLIKHQATAIYLMTNIVRPSTEPFDKDRAYWAVRLIHERFPQADRHIVWQIGNEVVSGHFDPKGVWDKRSAEQKQRPGVKEDNFFGYDLRWKEAYYVNGYLAPAIEAIERVSRDIYGDPRTIQIALGSMNPYNRQNVEFLKNVMDRKFDSDLAPTLKGDEVWKHFDYLTVHYMTGSARTIARLQQYHDDYLQTGKIKGIWVTEDHGRGGRGPVTIIGRGFRFLGWAAQNNFSCQQARLCWWGERERDPGGQGAEAAELIGEFLAGRPLCFALQPQQDATVYTLSDSSSADAKRILVALVPEGRNTLRLGSLTIHIPKGARSAKWTVDAIQYSSTKPGEHFTPQLKTTANGIEIAIDRVVPEPALLLLKRD